MKMPALPVSSTTAHFCENSAERMDSTTTLSPVNSGLVTINDYAFTVGKDLVATRQ